MHERTIPRGHVDDPPAVGQQREQRACDPHRPVEVGEDGSVKKVFGPPSLKHAGVVDEDINGVAGLLHSLCSLGNAVLASNVKLNRIPFACIVKL